MKEHNLWREVFFISLIIACFIALFYIVFGQYGWITLRRENSRLQKLQLQINKLQQENHQLKRKIEKLQTDPKTIEMEIRKKMLYGKPGEIIYQIMDPKEKNETKDSK